MNEEIFSLIKTDTDAVASNRGFYYQYLNVALQWISHYIDGNKATIYTEAVS